MKSESTQAKYFYSIILILQLVIISIRYLCSCRHEQNVKNHRLIFLSSLWVIFMAWNNIWWKQSETMRFVFHQSHNWSQKYTPLQKKDTLTTKYNKLLVYCGKFEEYVCEHFFIQTKVIIKKLDGWGLWSNLLVSIFMLTWLSGSTVSNTG